MFVLLCPLYQDEFDTYEVLSLAFLYYIEVLHLTCELTYEVFPAQRRYVIFVVYMACQKGRHEKTKVREDISHKLENKLRMYYFCILIARFI